MVFAPWITTLVLLADLAIRVGLSGRVILRRRPASVTFSWLLLILIVPFVGAFIYLLVGESRLGRRRAEREVVARPAVREAVASLSDASPHDDAWPDERCRRLAREFEAMTGMPAMRGHRITLLPDAAHALPALLHDIQSARRTIRLEYYIWEDAPATRPIHDALLAAAARGVECRVMVDGVAGREFLAGPAARRLRDAGVRVIASLPIGWMRAALSRVDLRNHRKLAVIDGDIAHIGSMNMVDAATFNQSKKVGRWVDAVARFTGPGADACDLLFLHDWELETGELLAPAFHPAPHDTPQGGVILQPCPSGPGLLEGVARDSFASICHTAREELLVCTPYFVPDDPARTALLAAARRGVRTTLILPKRVDNRPIGLAMRSHVTDLVQAGVQVCLYSDGLLHTKAAVADRRASLIGSANLDARSFWLNFELNLAVFDDHFGDSLAALLESYRDRSTTVDPEEWSTRALWRRLLEAAMLLLSPIL